MVSTFTDKKGIKVSLFDLVHQLKRLDERLNSQEKVLTLINSVSHEFCLKAFYVF